MSHLAMDDYGIILSTAHVTRPGLVIRTRSEATMDGNDLMTTMPNGLMHVGRDLALAVVGLMLAVYTMGVVDDTVALAIDFVALGLSAMAMLYCIKGLVGLEDMISSSINSSPKCVIGLTMAIATAGCFKSSIDVVVDLND